MKQQAKKKNIFSGKGIFIVLMVITSLLVITVAMNLVLPEEIAEQAAMETESSHSSATYSKQYDDGLTSVYTEQAVAANSNAAPATPAPTPQISIAPAPHLLRPVSGSGISKDFSADELVFSETMQDWRVHEGIDFPADEGAEVIAAADGVVELAGEDGMMGICVLLSHPDGTMTYYANLQETDLPQPGA